MLLQFSIENYLSFKEKATISFEAESIRELRKESVFLSQSHQILKSIGIKGYNAAGKSNIIKAFEFFVNFVNSQSEKERGIATPFLFDIKTSQKTTMMEAIFLLEGTKYRYGFEILGSEIKQEWLYITSKIKEEPYFVRADDLIRFDRKIKAELRNKYEVIASIINPTAPFIVTMNQFKDEVIIKVIDWIRKIIIVTDSEIDSLIDFTASLQQKENYHHEIITLFKEQGIDIHNFEDEVIDKASKLKENYRTVYALWFEEEIKKRQVKTKHFIYDGERQIDTILLNLRTEESSGTQKLFAIAGPILLALKYGHLIIIDELDSKFHFEVLNFLIRKFNSIANQNGSQLLFNSHNTTTLDSKKSKLRRDQLYLVEKDKFGASILSSMYAKDPTIRHDSAIQKNYESGLLFKVGEQGKLDFE